MFLATTLDCIACNSMTIAYQRDRSGFVSLFGYCIIIYSFLLDIVWFDEDLVWLELLGALLIFAVTFVIAFYKLCEQHKARKLTEQ